MMRFGILNRRSVFSHIYKSRYWGDTESVSGPGSSLDQTAPIRDALPALVRERRVSSIFDAPCGDLNWMKAILPAMAIDYEGGDIVPELVDRARRATDYPNAVFRTFDITRSSFPLADLWLCRDVLFHLSFTDIQRVLDNFARSSIPYVLVTSHIGGEVKNRPIVTGDFRQLDLLKAPFKLKPEDVITRFYDFVPPARPREMLLLNHDSFARLLG